MRLSWSDGSVAHPKVVVTAKGDDFDKSTIQNWRAEGFEVSYLPFTGSREDYVSILQHLANPLELGENFAIVGLRTLMVMEHDWGY